MHELGSIDVMRLDQTLGQSRRVACASSCMSMRTSLEEGIQPHRFAAIFPEQFLPPGPRKGASSGFGQLAAAMLIGFLPPRRTVP
jgi:hypothetical protein